MFNFFQKKNTRSFGVTQTQFIITLFIIAFISLIFVPAAVVHYDKKANLQRIQKSYTTIAQSVNMAQFVNGQLDEWGELTGNDIQNYYSRFVEPYYSVMTNCSDYTSCGYKSVSPWKKLNKSIFEKKIEDDNSNIFFYFPDGQFVGIKIDNMPECSQYNDEGVCEEYISEPDIIVDVNGFKPPNIIGKDVFLMNFSVDKGVVPYCHENTKAEVNSNCRKNGSGECCLKRVMSNFWKFDDDYPL